MGQKCALRSAATEGSINPLAAGQCRLTVSSSALGAEARLRSYFARSARATTDRICRMTAAPKSAAERMRSYRKRCRRGLKLVHIELHITDIDALVRRKLLSHEE